VPSTRNKNEYLQGKKNWMKNKNLPTCDEWRVSELDLLCVTNK
jgi:hypothetical protein